MGQTNIATLPIPRQALGAKPTPAKRVASGKTGSKPLLSDKVLYGNRSISTVPNTASRLVANLDKTTITQLLTVEKKRTPDYAWYKPKRVATDGAPVGYYCYPCRPEPLLLAAGPMPVALLPAVCRTTVQRSKAYVECERLFKREGVWPSFILNVHVLPAGAPIALPATVSTPRIDTSPLVEAAKRKEDALLLKIAPSTDCLQHPDPITFAPAPAALPGNGQRFWAGRSPTPELPETIDTENMCEMLYKATHSDPDNRARWLIGPVSRWNGKVVNNAAKAL